MFETLTVVHNNQFKRGPSQSENDANFGCFRVFDHVMQGLLEGEEQIMPNFRGQSPFGKLDGHVQAATDASRRQ